METANNELAVLLNELNKAYGIIEPHLRKKLGFEKKWEYLNQPPYHREVDTEPPPVPVITVQPKGKRKTDSWYVPKVWKSEMQDAMDALTGESHDAKDEIVIASSILSEGMEKVLQELGKQMVHQEVRHCGTGYSNETISYTGWVSQVYADNARKAGFYKEEEGNNKLLSDSKWMAELIEKEVKPNLDDSAFSINRKEKGSAANVSPLKKWSCKCSNVRTAVVISADCKLCGEEFQYTDKDWDDDDVKTYIENELKTLLKDKETSWGNWKLNERKTRIRNEAAKAGRK